MKKIEPLTALYDFKINIDSQMPELQVTFSKNVLCKNNECEKAISIMIDNYKEGIDYEITLITPSSKIKDVGVVLLKNKYLIDIKYLKPIQ